MIRDKPWSSTPDFAMLHPGYLLNHGLAKGQNNEAGKNCASCEYSIEIRNGRGKDLSFNMTPRTYIWKGGTIAAKITTDPVTGVVTTTPAQDWCFAFGEKEWVEGV